MLHSGLLEPVLQTGNVNMAGFSPDTADKVEHKHISNFDFVNTILSQTQSKTTLLKTNKHNTHDESFGN